MAEILYRPVYDSSLALVIGIDSYSDPRFPPLSRAEADACEFADVISGPPYHFFIQTLLLGEAATKAAIQDALYALYGACPDDRIIIYFSGHGYTLLDNRKNETGYIAATDTVSQKHYTALELREEVLSLTRHSQAKHIAFILDSCFSGQALGLTKAGVGPREKFLERRAYQVIAAGAGDQSVTDTHSMTEALVDMLRHPDPDACGLFTLSDLGVYVREAITADSLHMQIPQFGQLLGSQGGDLVFCDLSQQPYRPPDVEAMLRCGDERTRLQGVYALIDLARSGDTVHANLARNRLVALADHDPGKLVREVARGFVKQPSPPLWLRWPKWARYAGVMAAIVVAFIAIQWIFSTIQPPHPPLEPTHQPLTEDVGSPTLAPIGGPVLAPTSSPTLAPTSGPTITPPFTATRPIPADFTPWAFFLTQTAIARQPTATVTASATVTLAPTDVPTPTAPTPTDKPPLTIVPAPPTIKPNFMATATVNALLTQGASAFTQTAAARQPTATAQMPLTEPPTEPVTAPP